jgi:hypothetical protein
MSGFITTMFVSSPSSAFLPAFPAKPKPLVPIFTFAQSQSCMNLRMDLDVRDFHDIGLDGDAGSEISRSRSALDLARPRDTYQSSIIGPAARARAEAPRNRGYFSGTSLLSSFFSNPRTRAPFKPQKSNRGTSSWQLKQYAEATLGSGSLRKAVKLPEGEDKDEWLAVNGMTQ